MSRERFFAALRKFRENYVKINNFPEAYAEIDRYFAAIEE
jgi:hypothetical protein